MKKIKRIIQKECELNNMTEKEKMLNQKMYDSNYDKELIE